uniref:X1.B.G6.2 n=1 Tax=Schmidtea mediterranea TaxID=79327 RepID=V9XTG1_SCHMD|nr:X1.B.G6.2 [Schmidtea mediterranea]
MNKAKCDKTSFTWGFIGAFSSSAIQFFVTNQLSLSLLRTMIISFPICGIMGLIYCEFTQSIVPFKEFDNQLNEYRRTAILEDADD